MNILDKIMEDLEMYSKRKFSDSVNDRLEENLKRYIELLENSSNNILSKNSKLAIIKELSK